MDYIQLDIKESIANITINKEASLNAINIQVLDELNLALDALDKEKDLRCLIITGAGKKAFVAGADIKEMQGLESGAAQGFAEKGQKVFRRLEITSYPVIAAVNGFALGGGLELAMACDFIYASENAVFGLPEVSLGLMPGFGGTVRLAKYIGIAKAKEMTYTAKKIDANTALNYGLVNAVYSSDELLTEVKKVAVKIAKLAPIAIGATKGAINQSYDITLDSGMHLERTLFGELFRSKDMKNGVQAFINKEKPVFIGE